MEKTQKNKKNIFSKLAKSFVAMLVVFASVFFAACSNSASTSGYDAYGKYRIAQARLTYYEATSDGKTNEHTGSFLVPMQFYYEPTEGQLDNAKELAQYYDQDGDKAMAYNNNESFTGKKLVYPDFTFTVDGNIYQIHVTVNTSKLVMKSSYGAAADEAYFNKDNYVKATTTLDNIFSFTYRVGTTGEWLDASDFVKAVYLNIDQDIIEDYYDTATGKSAQDDLSSSFGANESFDRVFYLKFDPRLENGSTNRRIRVKAVPNMDMTYNPLTNADKSKVLFQSEKDEDAAAAAKRGDSVYSATKIYQAYRLTFQSYSINSSQIDYGQLSYDAKKFYFYETNYTYSISMTEAQPEGSDYKVNYLSSITGYFPSGRVVVVNRDFETTYDGKTIEYLGQVVRDPSMGSDHMAIGRQIMVCCADDTSYRPLVAKYSGASRFKTGDWVVVTGKIKVEKSRFYDGKGPVVYVTSIEKAAPAVNPVATFN